MTARFSMLLRALALLLAAQLVFACSGAQQPEEGPVVLAAASLQEALTDVAQAWTDQGHAAPVLSFAASSALARQVEQGAPADVFISADEEWMDALAQKNLLRADTRGDILTNRIVVIGPRDGVRLVLTAGNLAQALGDGRLALADPAAVPAGKYAQDALESLGLWTGVAEKVVPAENVRAALALVERGEAPLGIAYATDAQASDKVAVLAELPETSHSPIRYPVAVLAASKHPDAAAFRAFLISPEAQALFGRRGFGIAQ